MTDINMEALLEEIRAEVNEKREEATLPPFPKKINQEKFLSEEYDPRQLQDSLRQSWSKAYVEMAVLQSRSKIKQKIKDILVKAVGLCVNPICTRQTFYNLNNTEALYQMYAYIGRLEEENKKLAERIAGLEQKMGEHI